MSPSQRSANLPEAAHDLNGVVILFNRPESRIAATHLGSLAEVVMWGPWLVDPPVRA
jgi:hypothetical protein